MVFDMPTLRSSYAERYQTLSACLFHSPSPTVSIPFCSPRRLTQCSTSGNALEGKGHRYIELAPYEECKDFSYLEKYFQDVVDKGGEGIILRDPIRPYESGNTQGYLKHKVQQTTRK